MIYVYVKELAEGQFTLLSRQWHRLSHSYSSSQPTSCCWQSILRRINFRAKTPRDCHDNATALLTHPLILTLFSCLLKLSERFDGFLDEERIQLASWLRELMQCSEVIHKRRANCNFVRQWGRIGAEDKREILLPNFWNWIVNRENSTSNRTSLTSCWQNKFARLCNAVNGSIKCRLSNR